MLNALASSFFLIFLAEMGDKTQLAALAFTAKYKTATVIAAISAAILAVNFIAVCAGSILAGVLPLNAIKIVSCVLFIFFGLWTLFLKEKEGENKNPKTKAGPFFTVFILFFVSEFGDKTQIAAMTLSMSQSPVFVFLGASLGMICANLIGISAGVLLGKKLPSKHIKIISAALFIIIGVAGLITTALKSV